MTDSILCTPDFQEGKPVFGLRIEAMITVTHPDGRVEELSGGGDLCEAKHAKPFLSAIEYLRAAGAPPIISAIVEPAEQTRPALASPQTQPAAKPAQILLKVGVFRCLECMEDVQYRSRPHHAARAHDTSPWEIKWTPLFDISGWPMCTCGYAVASDSGIKAHAETAGEGHNVRAEPYLWKASDMRTNMGEALARAAGK